MCSTRHIEQKSVWRINRHKRRETLAPIGNGVEQFRVRRFVGLHDIERRDFRARIGKRHAGAKFQPRGMCIHRVHAHCVFVLVRDDKRNLKRLRGSPLQPVRRQTRQPQRQNPSCGNIHRQHSIP